MENNNNILTPKEWLEREGVFSYNHFTVRDDINDIPRTEDIMERYTSYKTKVLEDRIGEFRMYLLLNIVPYSADDTIQRKYLKDFENIFNITTKK